MRYIKTKKGNIALPVMNPIIVPIYKVEPNKYNPNKVAINNMELLERSILDNGFCFAVVTIYDQNRDKYIIVDGFHRYEIFKKYFKAKEIPIIVLEHNIEKRMAATVQFNRARGVHQVELMGELVRELYEKGLEDEKIANTLGMEEEEVFRLKQITGIAEIFKNKAYSKSWEMQEVDDD